MTTYTTRTAALFVDFDNIYLTIKNEQPLLAQHFAEHPADWLSYLITDEAGQKRRFLIRRCYLNPESFGRYRGHFLAAGFDVVDCPPLTQQGKTAADMYMTVDIMERLQHTVRYDDFILMSADADFAPVLKKLREHDRRTTVVLSGYSSSAYLAITDQVINYHDLIHGTDEPAPDCKPQTCTRPNLSAQERSHILAYIQQLLEANEGPMTSAQLLEALRQEYEQAADNWFGHDKLALFLQALDSETAGIVFIPEPPGMVALKDQPISSPNVGTIPLAELAPEYDDQIIDLMQHIFDTTHIPALTPQAYGSCFDYIATEINQPAHTSLTSLSKGLRDHAQRQQIKLSRQEANRIITLLSFNQIDFSQHQTPETLIEAFEQGILHQYQKTDGCLTEQDQQLIRDWLGDWL